VSGRAGQYDVVVLGSGAAGLTAAVRAAADGARVGLFEKADLVGGTSAWSGGTVWLPNSRHEAAAGLADSRPDVVTYLLSLSHGLMERPLIEAYADTAPEVAAWLEDNTAVVFEVLAGMSDYHPEHPGGKREGRSLECTLFPFDELGEWAARVTVGCVVGRDDRRRRAGTGPGALAGQLGAHPPALDHGQRRRRAVHQRGG
jgi:3-oxosteroid 1-dehydrogenase